MSKTNVLFMLMSSTVVVLLCFYYFRSVKGSGRVLEENRQVKAFNSVNIEGIGKVVYTKGDTQKVSVVTDDNILKYIKTETKDGTLFITCGSHALIKPSKLEIHITSKSLQAFSGKGAISLAGKDTLSTDELLLSLIGKGSISLQANAEKIATSVKGNGHIDVRGSAVEHMVKIIGNGRVNSRDLKTEMTSLTIVGNGEVELYATEKLALDLKGNSEIWYKGDAEVKKKIMGNNVIKQIK